MVQSLVCKHSIPVDLLVIWYGFFQLIHIVVNILSLLALANGGLPYHAFPPVGGWSEHLLSFFTGMISADLINGVLAMVFIYGYFNHTKWYGWLGTLTLTISVYSAIILDYTTITTGAWATNLPAYLLMNLIFVPVLLLFGLFCFWGIRGEI